MKRIVAMLFAVCLCLTAMANVSYAENWQVMYEEGDYRIAIDTDSAKQIKKGVYQAWVKTNDGIMRKRELQEFKETKKSPFIAGTCRVLKYTQMNGNVVDADFSEQEISKMDFGRIYLIAYLNQTLGDKTILPPEMKWYYSSDTTTYTYNVNSVVYHKGKYYVWIKENYPYMPWTYKRIAYEISDGPVVMYCVRKEIIPHEFGHVDGVWHLIDDNIAVKRLYEAIVATKPSRK